ncbi:hypothetical protein DdX_18999 [Ditylenchus destructor]|uniref:Uncharacterized protein n=1 Tax=Ditylenchus destructor TaxID=166010 RepID=A0AAD4QSI0_9BILA|nr:hypothetical protein DdX_18999 [Ditylenchus destructor]
MREKCIAYGIILLLCILYSEAIHFELRGKLNCPDNFLDHKIQVKILLRHNQHGRVFWRKVIDLDKQAKKKSDVLIQINNNKQNKKGVIQPKSQVRIQLYTKLKPTIGKKSHTVDESKLSLEQHRLHEHCGKIIRRTYMFGAETQNGIKAKSHILDMGTCNFKTGMCDNLHKYKNARVHHVKQNIHHNGLKPSSKSDEVGLVHLFNEDNHKPASGHKKPDDHKHPDEHKHAEEHNQNAPASGSDEMGLQRLFDPNNHKNPKNHKSDEQKSERQV